MTMSALHKELNVHSLGHRVKLMNAIDLLRKGGDVVYSAGDMLDSGDQTDGGDREGQQMQSPSREEEVIPASAATEEDSLPFLSLPPDPLFAVLAMEDMMDRTSRCYNGVCSITDVTGGVYTGEWVDGVRVGKGVYVSSANTTYTGDFFNNVAHGKGTLRFASGARVIGNFVNDRFASGYYVDFDLSHVSDDDLPSYPFYVCIGDKKHPVGEAQKEPLYFCDERQFFTDMMRRRGPPVYGFPTGPLSDVKWRLNEVIEYHEKEARDHLGEFQANIEMIQNDTLPPFHQSSSEGEREYNLYASNSQGSFAYTTAQKMHHDYQQMSYLMETGCIITNAQSLQLQSALKLLAEGMQESDRQHWSAQPLDTPRTLIFHFLKPDQYLSIAAFHNKNFYSHPIPRVKHALNPNLNYKALEDAYLSSYPEILTFDDFLSEDALEIIYEFCLRSTIFYDIRMNYFGAYAQQGFSGPLLHQIAEELRARFPRIFGTHLLSQAWAYKYDNSEKGIKVHADVGAVNCNFWVTPTEANLDPSSGGLIVYDVEAPDEWNFADFNTENSVSKVYEFLEKENANKIVIPYKRNRMVMFNSNLFHTSDHNGKFEPTLYSNRRINITYLFGARQDRKKKLSPQMTQ
jgi:hypothetical protein